MIERHVFAFDLIENDKIPFLVSRMKEFFDHERKRVFPAGRVAEHNEALADFGELNQRIPVA